MSQSNCSSPFFNKLANVSVSLSSVNCFSKVIEPKEEVIGIYSQLVRRTGDNMGLWLATKAHACGVCVCECVELGSWGKQSCGAEPSTCGIWHYLQADGVRIPLDCRAPSWSPRELSAYIHIKLTQSCQLFVTPWTVACRAPLSMGFSQQESWSGSPCPPSGDLPNPGTEPRSPVAPTLQVDSSLLSHRGSPRELPGMG